MSTFDASHALSIGQCATLACLMEVTAPKPGNVHRGADFEDLCYGDFLVAAAVIGPVLGTAAANGLGRTVLAAVEATRAATGTNVNLGTILLLTPLAMVPRGTPLEPGIAEVLSGLDATDARDVYQAIRLAQPGGLGRADADDVAGSPPDDLLAAMSAAAGRDRVALQYAQGFQDIFRVVLPELTGQLKAGMSLADAIVWTHLELMSRFPDSLIARKCGLGVAEQAAARARQTLAAGLPGEEPYARALADLDFWLRSDGHRRNPGTAADLIAAGLFAALRDGIIKAPYRLGMEERG